MLNIGQVIIDKKNGEVLIFAGIGIYQTKYGCASLSSYITENGAVELYPGNEEADGYLVEPVIEKLLNAGFTVKVGKGGDRDISNFCNPGDAKIPIGEFAKKVIGEGAYMGLMDPTGLNEEEWDILVKTIQRFSSKSYKLVTKHSKWMNRDITYVVLDEQVF